MKTQEIKLILENKICMQKSFIFLVDAIFEKIELESFTVLSPEEQKIFEKIPSQKRQREYLLGRYSAKRALCQAFSTPMNNIYIESGIFGQPVIIRPRDQCFQVSISHTNNLGVAIAFPETHPMGIDIEEISYKNNSTILSQMTNQEVEILNTKDLCYSLTVAWTAKEALSKILRCGLMISFNLLEISSYQKKEGYVECFFKNFAQYKSLSWKYKTSIITVVFPKNGFYELNLN